jgi:hypothetical protein
VAQQKIIVDTNAYVRLAQSIRPLLNNPFGPDNICLYVTKAVADELSHNQRIQTVFNWVSEDEYHNNRKIMPTTSRAKSKEIVTVTQFLYDYAVREKPNDGLSWVDCNCIASSQVLEYPLVTDDKSMHMLAEHFDLDITIFKTLDLLKMMRDVEHISKEKLHQIIKYLHHMQDLPCAFSEFCRHFLQIFGYDIKSHLK